MKKAFIEINHTAENNGNTHRYTLNSDVI